MERIVTQFTNSLGGSLSSVVGAAVFFIVGWIIALIAGSLVRKLMANININGRFNSNKSSSKGIDLERIASRLTFWFILLFAITGALNMLNLSTVSAPLANLLNQVTSFIPSLIGAAIIGLVGWAVATLARNGIQALLDSTGIDDKLSAQADVPPLTNTISNLAYWIILLIFIPMVLEKLGMKGLLTPVTNLIDKIMNFLPNLFIGGVIIFVGYIVARILRGITTNLISTLNLQNIASKVGIGNTTNIANLAGMVVFLMVMLPITIAGLDALKIESISRPAINMLNKIMDAAPNVLFALVILAVFYFVFRMISNIVSELLANTGVDALPEKMGVAEIFGENKVSQFVGHVLFFFAMLFGLIEAANLIGFTSLRDLVSKFIEFGSQIFFGGLILMVGFWIANAVSGIVSRSQEGSEWLGTLVRVVVMGLVIAMGLKAMGIADSIVNLAFGLTLGGAAVAFALAFGLGGQEAAGRVLKNTLDRIENDKQG